jgi:hypothetical protein
MKYGSFPWPPAMAAYDPERLALVCVSVQLDVTIYRFILEIQKLYMFRAFLAHPHE